jgi:hypothetical protein
VIGRGLRARTRGAGRGLQAQTRGLGVGTWDWARTLCTSATTGANASGAIVGEWARAGRTGREHSVLAGTEGNSHAAIAMGTRVWAQTGETSGVCCRGGGRTRLPKGRMRLRGWGV